MCRKYLDEMGHLSTKSIYVRLFIGIGYECKVPLCMATDPDCFEKWEVSQDTKFPIPNKPKFIASWFGSP